MRDLKPCPFCGAEPHCDNGFIPCESIFVVWCSNNGCWLNDIENPPTIKEWNTRNTNEY